MNPDGDQAMRDIDSDSGAQGTDTGRDGSTVSTLSVRNGTVLFDLENYHSWIQSDTTVDLGEAT